MSTQMLVHRCPAWSTTARLETTQMTIAQEIHGQNVVCQPGTAGCTYNLSTSAEAGGL